MLLGTDIASVLTTLTALGVDAVGLNCSTGPEDMRDAIRFLGENSPVPISCIPNAGIPHQGLNGETIFPEEPEPLARMLGEFVDRYGVGIVGGCCGTSSAIRTQSVPSNSSMLKISPSIEGESSTTTMISVCGFR